MSDETMWFEREPGSGVAKGTSDPNSILLGADVPDWVRLPRELGGARFRVASAVAAACPGCKGQPHVVRHLILDGTRIAVAECGEKGFLWYMNQETERTE